MAHFPIFDLDRHVFEPVEMWAEYLPANAGDLLPSFRPLGLTAEDTLERLKRLGEHALLPVPPVLCVGDRPIWADLGEVAQLELYATARARSAAVDAGASAGGHLTDMDRNGIAWAAVLPTYASYLVHDDALAPRSARDYARAYNRFMTDFVSVAPDRLCAPILLARQEPEALVEELEAALRVRVAPVVVRPNPVRGCTLSHPAYERFWAACAAASIPVLLHEGTHARVETVGRERYSTRFGKHACSHPLEMMMGLLSLIEGGVLDRHPALRVCMLEAGCGWLPYWLWRLDEVEYRHLRGEVRANVRRPPSEYFQRQCWVAAELGEPLLEGVLRSLGAERLVIGTDFPHLDHLSLPLDELWADCAAVGPCAAENVAWRNARRLLGTGVATPAPSVADGFDCGEERTSARRPLPGLEA